MKIKVKQIISVMLAVIMLACSFSIASSAAVSLFCPVGSIGMGTSNGYSSGHQGIDLAQGKGGSPVYAAIGGTVVNIYKCTSTHQSLGDCDGFGTGLIIQGTDGMYYQYAHMQANSIPSSVYVGASVSMGQQIGNVGMTGWATGYHLHFQIGSSRWSGAVNPLTYGTYSTSGGTKTLTVYFNANGGSGAPSNQTKTHGQTLTLSSTKPTKTGHTFLGWSTSSTATSATYSAGGSFTNNANTTLYAVWRTNKVTITYNPNGGTIKSDEYMLKSGVVCKSNGSVLYDIREYDKTSIYGLFNVDTFGLKKTGHHFGGWKNSSGKIFDENDETVKPSDVNPNIKNGDCSAELTAVWIPNKITITYNPNGATVNSPNYKLVGGVIYTSAGERSTDVRQYDETRVYGLTNAATFGLKKTGYHFGGWKNSSGKIFDENDETVKPSDVNPNIKNGDCSAELTAVWIPNKLTVNFYSNYATKSFSGALNPVSATTNVLVRIAYFDYDTYYEYGLHDYNYSTNSNYLARDGYSPARCYNTKPDGSGYSISQDPGYTAQEIAKILGLDLSAKDVSVNLYPQWIHSAHNYESKITKDSTCIQTGIKTYTCKTCGNSYTEIIPLKNHTDKNNDGYCDSCKAELTPHNPTNPTTPDSPSTPNKNCTCNCHKSGFTNFFWKILNFFHKILGLNKYKTCACGISHW